MPRLILLLIFSAATANAAETATTQAQAGPSPPSVQETKARNVDPSLPIDVCSDLVRASCNQAGPVYDGTGTTQEASTLQSRVIADANDFFRKNVAEDSKFKTAVNVLMNDGSAHGELRTISGENCEIEEPQCRARVKAKLLEIFQDRFLNDTRLYGNAGISWGCDQPECKWNANQAEAYLRLLRARKLDALDTISAEYAGKFFETQNIDMRKRTLEIFPKIREEMKRVLATMGLSEDMQKVLGEKIDNTSISTDCHGAAYDPRSFAWSNLMTDGSREIVVCPGMLTGNTSDFAMVYSLAHELTHQIDPCFIHFGSEGFQYTMNPGIKEHDDFVQQNPFYDGIRCLRDPVKSVGAALTDNFVADYFMLKLDLKALPRAKRTPFCEADRIPEAFSDAMGAKVMASYFQNPANTGGKKFEASNWRAGLLNTANLMVQPVASCEDPALYWQSPTDEYASKHLRMNGLLMANTEIRRLAGCGSKKSAFQQCL